MSEVGKLKGMLRPVPSTAIHRDTRASVASRLAALVVIPVLMGLLAGVLGVGPAIAAKRTVDVGVGVWDSIEIDPAVLTQQLAGHTTILDSDGKPFATFYTEDRVPVDNLSDVSQNVIDAVLSTEDRTFYEHGAFDEKGLARAALTGSGGGSGITQQYAKLLRLNYADTEQAQEEATDASLARKIVELKYAVELERTHTKDEILLGYLNAAYFGDGAYGIGAAARRYFNTTADRLTVGQAAMIAGLLKSPDQFNPLTNPEDAKNRRDTVLNNMVANGKLSQADADKFSAEEVGATSNPLPSGCSASAYPYYCQFVKSTILEDPAFGDSEGQRQATFQHGNLIVHTALNRKVQDAAQANIDSNFSSPNVRVAQAVVQPGTGRVLAMVQNTEFKDIQFDLVTSSTVQTGSAFKPITLAAALSRGFNITTKLSGSSPWTPPGDFSAPAGGFRNNEGLQLGSIDAATALKFSSNTWFARLAAQTGVQNIADTAYQMGMTSMNPQTRTVGNGDLSITLGAFESTPLDMANVYATLAASGVQCRALPIVKVTDENGKEKDTPDPACHQSISKAVADTVTNALNATQSEGGGAARISVPGQNWVGKTGTTTDFGATWFAGYTTKFASAVWLGDPRGSTYPVKDVTAFGQFFSTVYGSDVAAPLWASSMRAITSGQPATNFPTPGPITADTASLPNVVGMSEAAARKALQLAGVKDIHVTYESSDREKGTVLAQKPKGGTTTVTSVNLEVAR